MLTFFRILATAGALFSFGCGVDPAEFDGVPPGQVEPGATAPVVHPPAVVHIVWADGQRSYPGFCEGTVSTWFRCVNGETCRPRILDGVRSWLAPFNAVVTDTDGGTAMVTVLMSSGLAEECGQPTGLRGRALIGAPAAGSWINVWSAGNDDAADAQNIAHELGHAIGGLEHVDQGSVMQAREQPLPIGYDDADRANVRGTTQNAFGSMASVLGVRP